MSTELLAPFPVMGGATANIINPATGDTYTLSARGSVLVNDADVPYFLTQGYIKPSSGGGGGGGGGGGTGVSFDTRAAAIAATVPSTTDVIMTGGYAAPGDGGHALYKRTSSIVYPTYGFTSSDGSHWEYIPEPTGWNARAAGVVADQVTDDSQNMMNALLPFQEPTIIVGGGNVTGTLLLPTGVMILKSPIFVVGNDGTALLIKGQSIGAGGGPVGTAFQWHGTVGYPSMFIVHGCNNFHLESVNFDGGFNSPASGLVNSIHLNADNTMAPPFTTAVITLTAPVTAGTARIFTCSQAINPGAAGVPGVLVGAAIGVGAGTTNFEIVYVTAATNTSFTATCVHNHAAGEKVGGSNPCNNLFIVECSITAPDGPKTAGILCGNEIQQTVQVAEFLFRNLVLAGNGAFGSAYSGIRAIVGGNIKNYSIENSSFIGFNTAIAGEAFSGNVELKYLTFAGTTAIDILANSSSNLLIDNYESESSGNMMLKGTGGSGSQGATIIQSSYQCGLPDDLYVIDWFGNLTLIGNGFLSGASSGPSVGLAPRVKCGGISNFTPTGSTQPSGITSIGNYWQFGGPDIPVFYDGSNNALDYLDFSVGRRWCVSQFNDYGDEGKYHDKFGALSIVSAAMSNTNASPGIQAGSKGDICDTFSSYTIPFAALQAASTSKTLQLWEMPAHTFVTGVVADIITPYSGTGITSVSIQVGTNAPAVANNFLKSFSGAAVATFGLVNADLGAALASATRASPIGFVPSSWPNPTDGDFISLTVLSVGANLSALTAGSMVVYVMCKRLIPGAGLQPSLLTAPSGRKGRQRRLKRPSLD